MNLSETERARQSEKPGGSPGILLGETRQEQNLSVSDVARQLKLSVQQVEALEAGEYDRLPGPVFVRGFIRNYARLLKLDPEALVHSAARSLPHEEQRPAAPPSQDIPFPTVAARRWPKYAVAIALVAVALAAYEFYLSEPTAVVRRSASGPTTSPAAPAPQPDSRVVQPSLAVAPAGAGAAAGAVSAAGPETLPRQPTTPAAADREGATHAASAGLSMQHSPSALASSHLLGNEASSRPGEREVYMIFDEESWVEIRDRTGKAIFSQLNRPGTEKRVNGRPPLSLIVGNSPGVRLSYDDQPVDLSRYTKIDVARLTLQ